LRRQVVVERGGQHHPAGYVSPIPHRDAGVRQA
jgi:hypothetical protein